MKTIYIVVITLKDKGQIIHMAFEDIHAADAYAKDLEPTVKASREDYAGWKIIPCELRPSQPAGDLEEIPRNTNFIPKKGQTDFLSD